MCKTIIWQILLVSFSTSISAPTLTVGVDEVLVEARSHARLTMGTNTVLATTIFRAPGLASDPPEAAFTQPSKEYWVTLLQDNSLQIRVISTSYRDLETDIEVHHLLLTLEGQPEFEIRVEYNPGIDAKTAGDFWDPTEYGVRDPSSWVFELNGRQWTFTTHDIFMEGGVHPLDEDIDALDMSLEAEVAEALAKFSEYSRQLSPSPPGSFFPNNMPCRGFMPIFLRKQCCKIAVGEAKWETAEIDCDFDSSFGFPCDSTVIKYEAKELYPVFPSTFQHK